MSRFSEFKMDFLRHIKDKGQKEKTLDQYRQLFDKVDSFEKSFKKDFYDFTAHELGIFFTSLKIPLPLTLNSRKSLINSYCKFAIEQNKSIHKTSIVEDLRVKEYIDTSEFNEKYCTQEELYFNISKLSNLSDMALCILLFKGINGERSQELLKLKISDYDEAKATIFSNGVNIKLSIFENNIIQSTIKEKYYISYNTNRKKKHINSEYLLKNLICFLDDSEKDIDLLKSSNRVDYIMRKISKYLNKKWTTQNIYTSGVVYRIVNLNPDWTYNEVREYLDKNNIKLNYINVKYIADNIKNKINIQKLFNDNMRVNFNEINEFKKHIGDMGEKYVLEYEMRRLKNYPNLLKHVSDSPAKNPALGYDILSFDEETGEDIFIEVKTEALEGKEFVITSHELSIAKQRISNGEKYYIYRVSNILDKNKVSLVIIKDIFNETEIMPNDFKVKYICDGDLLP